MSGNVRVFDREITRLRPPEHSRAFGVTGAAIALRKTARRMESHAGDMNRLHRHRRPDNQDQQRRPVIQRCRQLVAQRRRSAIVHTGRRRETTSPRNQIACGVFRGRTGGCPATDRGAPQERSHWRRVCMKRCWRPTHRFGVLPLFVFLSQCARCRHRALVRRTVRRYERRSPRDGAEDDGQSRRRTVIILNWWGRRARRRVDAERVEVASRGARPGPRVSESGPAVRTCEPRSFSGICESWIRFESRTWKSNSNAMTLVADERALNVRCDSHGRHRMKNTHHASSHAAMNHRTLTFATTRRRWMAPCTDERHGGAARDADGGWDEGRRLVVGMMLTASAVAGAKDRFRFASRPQSRWRRRPLSSERAWSRTRRNRSTEVVAD